MNIVRVRVGIDETWRVTVAWEGPDGPVERVRQLRSTGTSADGRPEGFPLPPEDDCPDGAHASLYQGQGDEPGLTACRDRILQRRPEAEDVEIFGRYLFATLLGDALWAEIREAAGKGQVDLALDIPIGAPDLHRLNWEMMCGPHGFLARGAPLAVSVTRVVPGAEAEARGLQSPPRLLFVVGSSLNDPRIRPGAEYMGLLRRIDDDDRVLRSRVVEAATPDRVRRAVDRHRPDVVFVVCHGGEDRGEPYLEFQLEEGETDPAAALIKAPGLLDMLRDADGKLPAMVVLAACGSGGLPGEGRVLGPHATAPLAAHLVLGADGKGVPVVVAMAGDISDRACRHFTRRFGQMLVRGEKLLRAAELGRRAAFIDPAAPRSSADWALPAVFTSQGVDPDFRPVPEEDEGSALLGRRIRDFELLSEPVFCGRQHFMQLFDELFDPREAAVLCLYSERGAQGAGKSRILHEFVGQAIRDGVCPVLVGEAAPGSARRFAGATDLGLEVLASIARTRRILGLDPPVESALLRAILARAPDDEVEDLGAGLEDLPEALFEERMSFAGRTVATPENRDGRTLASGTVRELLRADLEALAEDAAREAGTLPDQGPIVLFDNVHTYDEGGILALFTSQPDGARTGAPRERPLLGPDGLGSTDRRIPVVVAFSMGSPADEFLQPLQERQGWGQRLRVEKVGGFVEGEDALAFQRVLLHPYSKAAPGLSDIALAPARTLTPADRDWLVDSFRLNTRHGMPGAMGQPEFYSVAMMAIRVHYLEEADDENRLQQLIEEQGAEDT